MRQSRQLRETNERKKTKLKTKENITLNEAGTHAIMSTSKGNPVFTAPIKEFRSGDMDGHEWLTMEVVGWGDYISYDDGETWQEME